MLFISLFILGLAGFFLFSLFIKIIKGPIKLIFKLLINAALGFVALWLINFFGDPIGLSLGVNWINALIIGVFGFPGVVVLAILHFLL